MDNKKTYFTIGNIIGESVNLYTNNFLKFWLPYILVSVPITLFMEILKRNSKEGFFSMGIFLIITSFISAAITLYVSIIGIQLYRNKNAEFLRNFKKLKKILIIYMLLQILMILGILGGLLLLIIPGIIFSLFWAVASIVFIAEKKEIRQSMKRSRFLTKGFKGEIIISYMIIAIASLALYAIFAIIASADLGGQTSFSALIFKMNKNPLSISRIIHTVLSSALTPLYPAMTIVMYHNLIKEKEGYETEELADSFLNESSE